MVALYCFGSMGEVLGLLERIMCGIGLSVLHRDGEEISSDMDWNRTMSLS